MYGLFSQEFISIPKSLSMLNILELLINKNESSKKKMACTNTLRFYSLIESYCFSNYYEQWPVCYRKLCFNSLDILNRKLHSPLQSDS